MSLPTAYTPLETLLLFQALRSETVDAHSAFNRISDQLKSVPLIRSHPTYDSGRLSPDALRELYLWLLKEEAKSDLERQLERDRLLQNGDLSPNSRKRKAASLSLPTVQEASKHAHLIPQLVTRLYARYREHTVREIREHERKYDTLVREVEEIEAGKWDERLQRQRSTASATKSPPPSTAAHTQRDFALSGSAAPRQKSEEGSAQTQTKIDALMNLGEEEQNGVSNRHRKTSSNTTLPPLSQMAPEPEALGIPPAIPGQGPPFSPSHSHPVSGPVTSTQAQQPLSRPSSSPRPVLHPPPGLNYPPASPVGHTGSPSAHRPPIPPQPYNTSQSPHPVGHNQSQYGYLPPQPPVGYYQQPPYTDHRGQYVAQPPGPIYPGYTPYPGYPLQQYPAEAQPHGLVPHQSPGYPQGPPPYPPHAATAPSTGPRPTRPPNARQVSNVIGALATPPRKERQPVWKTLPPVKAGTPLPRPEGEPLSPGLKRSELPARATRSTRNRGATLSEQPEELEALPMPARSRGRVARERTPHSVVSSTADEARMTRSHSVSTGGAIPTSEDRPESRGNVKIEPSTPAGFAEDPEPIAQEAQSGGGRLTRKRRGTLQSLQQPSQKRKRQESLGDTAEEWDTPPPKPSTVSATRNFHKLSQTIMNDINSHKHASYFANPVRDKDAPGYSEIIKHPQHLKGIRTAITAGSKAVQAAATESPSVPDTPTRTAATGDSSATTIELERTEDLIPPKAIVNAAQLEKEVLRMFANAVMFNPGDDGLVADAREMFEDVDAKMREWKGAEKEAGSSGVVEVEEEEGGKGKRRKL